MSGSDDDTLSSGEKGKRPYCICGLSNEMPWSDGSHTGKHRKRPVADAVDELGLLFCTCGASAKMPFCEPKRSDCVHYPANESG